MIRFAAVAVFSLGMLTAGPALAAPGAKLRGLDKISGAARTFEAPLNTAVPFGKLEVLVRSCQQTPPEEQPPETRAFIEIKQAAPTRSAEGVAEDGLVFQGWMFASSPSLNALEHPSYDIWVISCTS